MLRPLLLTEDDELIRNQMQWGLSSDYDVHIAGNREGALALAKQLQPPVVLLDLGLPPTPREATEGLQALQEVLQTAPRTKVIVVTGHSERAIALKAVELGAYDYFTKPIDLTELKLMLKRAYQLYDLEAENAARQREAAGQGFGSIIGNSPAMHSLYTIIRKVAGSDAAILMTGESGTGKELVARTIHAESPRASQPFVAINCGAIPENLLESELFGHEKGAFTGATSQRRGRIEFAGGGTLFLDEIGELPLALQVKLLRFLQDRTIERVGGREALQVDVRVIAATNRDLSEAIAAGTFRDDLYYRLRVVMITVPPLKERGHDAMLLAQAFLERAVAEEKKPVKGFTPEAWDAVNSYSWPGNVRELENRVKRAVIMAEERLVSAADLELSPPTQPTSSLRAAKEKTEREVVLAALIKHHGNITRAATELGLSRQALHEIIVKRDIRLPSD
jgi:two-component system NtrC family response regulator